MKYLYAALAALLVSSVMVAPADARHRRHASQSHATALPYRISYVHNYGPGPWPGTYAYYDGPLRARCAQSAAAYLGQDGRRHPCN